MLGAALSRVTPVEVKEIVYGPPAARMQVGPPGAPQGACPRPPSQDRPVMRTPDRVRVLGFAIAKIRDGPERGRLVGLTT
jgi:hypothetical protein